MVEKTIPGEQAFIEEILRRRGSDQRRIPLAEMKILKVKLGEEIERAGSLSREFVDDLLRQLS
jgi:hypothetical protein